MAFITLEPGGARPATSQESAWVRTALELCKQGAFATASGWVGSTVLEEGQLGVETDTGRAKIGNGTTIWSSLPYLDASARAYADTLTGGTLAGSFTALSVDGKSLTFGASGTVALTTDTAIPLVASFF